MSDRKTLRHNLKALAIRLLQTGYRDPQCPGEPPVYHSNFRPRYTLRRWIADVAMLILPELYHQDDINTYIVQDESHYLIDETGDRLKPQFADDPIDPTYYEDSEREYLSPLYDACDDVPLHPSTYGDEDCPSPPPPVDAPKPPILQPQIYTPYAL